MLETRDGSKYAGKFEVGEDWIAGELSFAGSDTRVHLTHSEFFYPDPDDGCLLGELSGMDKVSLFGCIRLEGLGQNWTEAGQQYFDKLDPHYVIHGSRWLRPADRLVHAIEVVVSDAPSIFNDHDTFSLAVAGRRQMSALLRSHSKAIGRNVELGPAPMVAFFRGETRIVEVETVLGLVSAHHGPSGNFGGPNGIHIKNQIQTTIGFETPLAFAEAIERLLVLLRFLELMAGRRQDILRLRIKVGEDQRKTTQLGVYWCLPPGREARRKAGALDWHDLPIDAVRDPEGFAKVLAGWLAEDLPRRAARSEFSDVIAQERRYSTVRLISAANVFDLLPSDAVCGDAALSPELIHARDEAQAAFRALPVSPERDSVLSALGRIGKPVLKRKIRHRAAIVTQALPRPLPHLEAVLDLAVEGRNVFVHGSASEIDF